MVRKKQKQKMSLAGFHSSLIGILSKMGTANKIGNANDKMLSTLNI